MNTPVGIPVTESFARRTFIPFLYLVRRNTYVNRELVQTYFGIQFARRIENVR